MKGDPSPSAGEDGQGPKEGGMSLPFVGQALPDIKLGVVLLVIPQCFPSPVIPQCFCAGYKSRCSIVIIIGQALAYPISTSD